MNQMDIKSNEARILKNKIISNSINLTHLKSAQIKDLFEVLDWSIVSEKRIIIDLCKIVSSRGETSLITGK